MWSLELKGVAIPPSYRLKPIQNLIVNPTDNPTDNPTSVTLARWNRLYPVPPL
jgi:hypothetical protein